MSYYGQPHVTAIRWPNSSGAAVPNSNTCTPTVSFHRISYQPQDPSILDAFLTVQNIFQIQIQYHTTMLGILRLDGFQFAMTVRISRVPSQAPKSPATLKSWLDDGSEFNCPSLPWLISRYPPFTNATIMHYFIFILFLMQILKLIHNRLKLIISTSVFLAEQTSLVREINSRIDQNIWIQKTWSLPHSLAELEWVMSATIWCHQD